MQHFANFGYVKQANKQLKKLNEKAMTVLFEDWIDSLPEVVVLK
jgi:hypothetical protein